MLTDHVINLAVTVASAVFFVTVTRLCRTAGADTWAAMVIGLAASAALVHGTRFAARRRS